jgi:hypothetical protein
MSKLLTKNNFKTETWSFEIEDIDPYYADILIGFTDETTTVQFDDLKFGYELQKENGVNQTKNYPVDNIKYVCTDQPFLSSDRLELRPNQNYTLRVWCENAGKLCEKTFEFSTSMPSQPFTSWVWENDRWNAPVSYPEDTETFYKWNEDTLGWEAVDLVEKYMNEMISSQ